MIISSRGNLLDRKYIWIFTLLMIGMTVPFAWFFFAKGYDMLFQLLGYIVTGPATILLLACLVSVS